MKKIFAYRDILYILAIFAWFMYPRQEQVHTIVKSNKVEVSKLEKEIAQLKEQATEARLLKEKYVHTADSLQQARQPIEQVLIQQTEKINDIQNRPLIVLPDTTLMRLFANLKTAPAY